MRAKPLHQILLVTVQRRDGRPAELSLRLNNSLSNEQIQDSLLGILLEVTSLADLLTDVRPFPLGKLKKCASLYQNHVLY